MSFSFGRLTNWGITKIPRGTDAEFDELRTFALRRDELRDAELDRVFALSLKFGLNEGGVAMIPIRLRAIAEADRARAATAPLR